MSNHALRVTLPTARVNPVSLIHRSDIVGALTPPAFSCYR
jgi:hypothetical protein